MAVFFSIHIIGHCRMRLDRVGQRAVGTEIRGEGNKGQNLSTGNKDQSDALIKTLSEAQASLEFHLSGETQTVYRKKHRRAFGDHMGVFSIRDIRVPRFKVHCQVARQSAKAVFSQAAPGRSEELRWL